MDENRTCPKCGNPECDVDDSYCWNCGIRLGNCCENEDCYMEGQVESENGGIVDLPENHVYCPYCGELTRYGKAGYIHETVFPL